jgi:hypothetical protein
MHNKQKTKVGSEAFYILWYSEEFVDVQFTAVYASAVNNIPVAI